MAQDLLKCLVQELIDWRKPLPQARKRRGKNFRLISLSAHQSAQAELYATFEASGLSRAEFARRLGVAKPKAERLFDLNHAAPLDQIEKAFRALGKKLELIVANAA